MDKSIDGRFERLEKALSNLIDSVTKYHRSTIQAEELQAADNDLSKGLVEVQSHQNNYLRIQQLRASSAALDAQIRDTLSSLASTRRDIVTTHTTVFPPKPGHPIAYEELLRYARRISKTTMPPAATLRRSSPPAPDASHSQSHTPDAAASASAAPTPAAAAATPSHQTPAATTNGAAANNGSGAGNTAIPEGMAQYLNPMSGQLFFPWPLEDKIRSGALAANQLLTERGIDPRGYDPAAEEDRRRREDLERREREDREKRDRADAERRMLEERAERERARQREQDQWRRASVADGQPAAPGLARANTGAGEKKQFQFTNLDDLDDDDDDD